MLFALDGNVVDFQNYDFWESEVNLGGAGSYAIAPFRSDYKNVDAFSSLAAHEILVVLHKQQGETVLGYRAWTLYNPGEPLSSYFNDGNNVCGTDDNWGILETNTFNYVTHTCIDSYVSAQVIEEEPLIYHDNYQVRLR